MTKNLPDGVDRMHRDHAALAVLRLLDGEVLRGGGNNHVLQELLLQLGLRLSSDTVRDIIGLLERTGALAVTNTHGLLVVELTRKGSEIARGLINEEGVALVAPDCPY